MKSQTVSTTESNFSSADLAARTIQRRAVEAVNWGIPMVNFDLMFQAHGQGRWSGEPDPILVAALRLEEPVTHTKPRHDLLHAVLQHKGRRTDGARNPAGGRWLDHRHDHGLLADGTRGCWTSRRRQGQGWQISDPFTWIQRQASRGIHRLAVIHVPGLCTVALNP